MEDTPCIASLMGTWWYTMGVRGGFPNMFRPIHYVYMYICIYVYMYICIYVYMYICIYVYMYICIYVYMYICIYVYMYICIYVYMCICICIHIDIKIERTKWNQSGTKVEPKWNQSGTKVEPKWNQSGTRHQNMWRDVVKNEARSHADLPSGNLLHCYWKWPSRNSAFTQL